MFSVEAKIFKNKFRDKKVEKFNTQIKLKTLNTWNWHRSLFQSELMEFLMFQRNKSKEEAILLFYLTKGREEFHSYSWERHDKCHGKSEGQKLKIPKDNENMACIVFYLNVNFVVAVVTLDIFSVQNIGMTSYAWHVWTLQWEMEYFKGRFMSKGIKCVCNLWMMTWVQHSLFQNWTFWNTLKSVKSFAFLSSPTVWH